MVPGCVPPCVPPSELKPDTLIANVTSLLSARIAAWWARDAEQKLLTILTVFDGMRMTERSLQVTYRKGRALGDRRCRCRWSARIETVHPTCPISSAASVLLVRLRAGPTARDRRLHSNTEIESRLLRCGGGKAKSARFKIRLRGWRGYNPAMPNRMVARLVAACLSVTMVAQKPARTQVR